MARRSSSIKSATAFPGSNWSGRTTATTRGKSKPVLRLEIVKRSDDLKGFVALPRRWVVDVRTMLQSARHVYGAGLGQTAFWRNAENDLDVVLIDFDPAHDGANNLPPAVAIETVESLHDLGGEILRAADDERKIAFETGCVFSSLMPLFD